MIEGETLLLFLVLLVGVTIIVSILIKAGLERIGIPSLVGYLLLGFGMTSIDNRVHFLVPLVREVYSFLAELGIISLLFRVGLESNLSGLLRQLPRASFLSLFCQTPKTFVISKFWSLYREKDCSIFF